MWVYSDIIKDEQWETNKSKLKGKSCNVVSLTSDDDFVNVTSLNDSKGEKPALVAQPPHHSWWVHVLVNSTCDSKTKYLVELPNHWRQELLHLSRPLRQRTKKSRRRFVSMSPWRRILPKDWILPFVLTYWHNWPISQLYYPTRATLPLEGNERGA